MKTQLSRNSFDPDKRYSGVYQQMGRMLTDADWNELSELGKNRLADVITDVINKGTPRERGIVEIIDQADGTQLYNLRWGYAYIDGIIAQVRPDANATLSDPNGLALEYLHQADFPNPPALPEADHILYLDVWERTIIALEDDQLKDAGLHGADTCTRTQTMAQVKWCELGVDPEDTEQNPAIGDVLLTLEIRQGSTEPDPCDPCAEEIALQDKLGNYLFRVEVHHVEYNASGAAERVWLKWSSENGAEQYALDNLPEGFASDPWSYEFFNGFFDEDAVIAESFATEKHLGRHLAPGFNPERGELVNGYPDSEPSGYSAVRRWDGYCELVKSGATWQLVTGSDRGVDLSAASSSDAHGHVSEGAQVVINHNTLTLSIDIADSAVLAGDYWLATVRQETNIAGDVILENTLPEGILHHYMTLGRVLDDNFEAYQGDQCKRFDFPSLTDIRAKDVCYDNSQCDDMPDVDTVQQAIDHLCQERDLRWHNKHLHGWGIVCGLVVNCGPNAFEDPDDEEEDPLRREITVSKGYAITCEGDDLVWTREQQQQPIDLIRRIQELAEQGTNLLDDGNGSVCLRLEQGPNGQPVIELEAYDALKHSNDSLLEGTLLMDFVQHCILDLVDAITQEFSFLDQDELDEQEGGNTGLVSEGRQKSISFINLVIQLINQENGAFVYLSRKEHLVLRDVYLTLQNLLQSKTFCAMFEGQEFPSYPQALRGPSTFFGKNLHTRIKMHPSAQSVYTYGGTDNTINVYDIASEKLIQIIEMPSAEGAEVSSIAFSNDGNLMIAAASVRGIDSVFGIARIRDKHSWEQMTILCDIEITEMQVSNKDSGLIYALGRGKGLFFLRPDVLMEQNKPQPDPAYEFNATAHMQIDQELQLAYCTANSNKDQDTPEYDQVLVMALEERENSQPTALNLIDQQGNRLTGEDGIALQQGFRGHLYVVTNAGLRGDGKQLLTFNTPINVESQVSGQLAIEDTQISLAFHSVTQQLILGLEDGYRLQTIDPTGQKTMTFRVPVQIQPLDIVVEPEKGQVYVLNYLSNTVSSIPAENLNVSDAYLQTLSTYRTEVIRAFYGLFGGLLQYLKDCFCDHLLVKCPECDDEDIIYLATVEIRNNEIYNICNFDKRKYVKSFPTMGYWFSLIPVWPMLKAAVGKMCCSILPDLFDNRRDDVIKPVQSKGNVPVTKNNRVKASTARGGIQSYQRTDIKAESRNQLKSTRFLGQVATDSARGFADVGKSKNAGVRKQALMESDVNEAISELNNNKIQVAGVKKYDAKDSRQYLSAFTNTPQRIEPDSKVTLYQKDGKVAFYTVEKSQTFDAVSIDENVKADLQQFENRKSQLADFSQLNAELVVAETRRADLAELEQVKSEIDALKSEKTAMQDELVVLRSQVSMVKTERDTLAADMTSLNASLEQAASKQKSLVQEFENSRPISDLTTVDEAAEADLQSAGIRTIGELAAADTATLSNLRRIDSTKMNILINDAKSRGKNIR